MIYIGFSTTNQLLSRIIRFFTGSKVSHCWLLYSDNGRQMVIEETLKGMRIIPFDKFQNQDNIIIDIIDTDYDLAHGLDMLKGHLGDNYDIGGLVGSFWVVVGRWFKKAWRNPLQNPKAMFCSEAIVKMLQLVNYPGASKLIPENTSPQDLLDFLKS